MILTVFELIKGHLNPSGMVIFDCWNEAGVLFHKPTVTERKVKIDSDEWIRIATPTHFEQENYVDVKFDFYRNNDLQFSENHIMRYFNETEFIKAANEHKLAIELLPDWHSKYKSNTNWDSLYKLAHED